MFPLKNLGRNMRKALLEPGYAVKAFTKRSKAYSKYLFDRSGKSTFPEAITLFLTFKCNLRCHMCGQWGDSGCNKDYDKEKLANEVKIDELITLLDQVKSYKPHITLFGGEPLMYGDIEKLIPEINKRKLHCCIITNGVLLEKYAKLIVESGIDEVSLSIDGKGPIHDEIRNVKGTFERIQKGVDALNALKAENKKKLPIINIVCTISEKNYENLEEMTGVAEQMKAHTLNFHHLIFTDNNVLARHNEVFKKYFGVESDDWKGFVHESMKNIDTEKLNKKIIEIKGKKYPFMVNFYPNFTATETARYYKESDFVSDSYSGRCLSPWMTAYIYPDGSVLPCHSLGYKAGNIHEKPFIEIWNGDKFKGFRCRLKKDKKFPVCPRCTEMYRY